MKLTTKAQMNAIDERAIKEYGIPGILLMEHAAYSLFRHLENRGVEGEKITILCGPGNNGGDGLALARLLKIGSKCSVQVILMASPNKLTIDGSSYYQICKKMNITLLENLEVDQICETIRNCDIIVDALFGTGLVRELRGDYYEVIQYINEIGKYVISADVPSGIHADTGKVLGIAVKADVTITFALPKVGLYIYPGIEYVGKIIVAEIGIPIQVIEECPSNVERIDEKCVKQYLPLRMIRSNKGTYGKVLLIGGSQGMSGAIALAAQSCMRTGAGTVTVAVPNSIGDILEAKSTESMTVYLEEQGGCIAETAKEVLESIVPKYDVIGIGPGMGRSIELEKILESVLKSDKPCVIDADGLYALKNQLQLLAERKAPTVLTPHPGEMAYLTGKPIEEILNNPIEVVKEFVRSYPVGVMLKLERMIIVDSEKIFINTTGNNGLAKGGSGDVLTGIITSLIGQNIPFTKAMRLGAFIHGKAADNLRKSTTVYSFLPGDICLEIGCVLKELVG
ncbi:MAG: NAD(P)H-hydrate dehydratase [Cellulosilyticaceae bacterium]